MTMNDIPTQKDEELSKEPPTDEKGGFVFSSSIKIYDPNTTEVLVQIRGDN